MGIISFLRNRAGSILIGAIGLALFAFLLGDAVQTGGSFMDGNPDEVGEVAGQAIKYEDLKLKVDESEANIKQQMGGLSPQMSAYALENAWNQAVSEMLIDKEVKLLGLQVSQAEMNDMFYGKDPHPQVAEAFRDPKTGQLNRAQISEVIDKAKTQGPHSALGKRWKSFQLSIKSDRLAKKYTNLLENSIYVTSLEAREDYYQRNKTANFSYISLEYASIPDNKITLSSKDYSDFYEENEKRFKNNPEESRSFEYVVFNANASKADSLATKNAISKIAADFRTTKNDSLFVAVHADTKNPVTYLNKEQLDSALALVVFKAPPGTIIGPLYSKGAYKVAKVIDVKMSPDSVKASHILFDKDAKNAKSRSRADSVLTLIRKGAKFEDMAAKFGTDGSKDKGGDLGTFGRGAMVPAFENAVFNGAPGEIKIVISESGIHIVRIEKHIGSSQVAKVAVVDKIISSSSKTQQEAYKKATEFLTAATDPESFDNQVKKRKLTKEFAENVSSSNPTVPGIENPREIVRWAFNADEGDITDKVYELDNQYVVAKLTDIREKGIPPLEQIKHEIELLVRNRVKARMLTEQLDKALKGASSINQVAQKVGKQVKSVQNIVFANPIIPGIGREGSLVGTVFGLQPKKLSRSVEGESGVFVAVLNNFINPAPLKNTFKQKEQILSHAVPRVQRKYLEVLKEKAEIKDNRIQFF